MTTTIRVLFEGLPAPFTASGWHMAQKSSDFEPLPDDATTLHISRKRGLFINRKPDRRPQELSVEEARKWGTDDNNHTSLIFAQARTHTSRYCVRLVPNLEKVAQRKRSKKFQALYRLLQDAKFHSTHFTDAGSWIVPVHYGMWIMDTGDWAGRVLLSITQWCGISWHELTHTRMNTTANRILVGRTFELLHDAGISLGDMRWRDALRHAIIHIDAPGLSREDLLSGKAPCYLVGFSEADAAHFCMRRVPVLPLGSYLSPEEVGCEEIATLLVLVDFTKKVNPSVSASKALEWHTTYSSLHPDQDNLTVTIAQRTRLYPNVLPLHPDQLTVSFDGEDEFSRRSQRMSPLDQAKKRNSRQNRLSAFRSDSSSPEPGLDMTEPDAHKMALVSLWKTFPLPPKSNQSQTDAGFRILPFNPLPPPSTNPVSNMTGKDPEDGLRDLAQPAGFPSSVPWLPASFANCIRSARFENTGSDIEAPSPRASQDLEPWLGIYVVMCYRVGGGLSEAETYGIDHQAFC
ncbi:hypothetical protein C8R47DRAFT_1066846 [Mycena vitilis]|nr:hypothetical protein C8R47DRAFT_1066846 [Mycena vitilis]